MEKSLLHPLLARERIVDACQRQASPFHRVNHRLQHRRLLSDVTTADQQRVTPGGNGVDRGLGHRVTRRNGLHFQVVRDNDALIPELLSKDPVHDVGRQGRRALLIQGHGEHMGGHDERHLFLDCGVERHELDGPQPIRRMFDHWQVETGIGLWCRRDRRCFPQAATPPAWSSFTMMRPMRATRSG